MILYGVSLYRQLKHRPGDVFHYSTSHSDYTLNNGSRFENVIAAELCADYMVRTAKLAILFFCQPSGGSAVRDGRIKCAAREDGHAKQESPRPCHALAGLVSRRRQDPHVGIRRAPIQGAFDRC
eukprot:8771656-Pyramimonas_sp.AAC.1